MVYKLGQSYLLPVKEVITENKRTFYKVEANGKEHNILLFDFANVGNKPENCCVVEYSLAQTDFISPLIEGYVVKVLSPSTSALCFH